MPTKHFKELFPTHALVATRDPEVMRQALFSTYGACGFDTRRPSRFSARASYLQLDRVAVGYCAYGDGTSVEFPEADFVRIQFSLGRAAVTTIGNRGVEINSAQACVTPARTANRIDFGAGYEQLLVRVAEDALKRRLTLLLGAEPKAALRFDSAIAADTPAATLLRDLAAFVGTQARPGALASNILFEELEDAVVTAFLTNLPHSYSGRLTEAPSDISERHARQVEDYIVAHFMEPITIEILTDKTGIGARTIFNAFTRRRGYTPMAFARMTRLKAAKKALTSGDPAVSVTQVALSLGFSNLGQFSNLYRKAFGELPSKTLTR